MSKLDRLAQVLGAEPGLNLRELTRDRGELTAVVAVADYLETARVLRERESLAFSQLIDLSGIDYSGYAGRQTSGLAVVCHFLSIEHNWRLRLKVFVEDAAVPVLPSLCELWPSANWYEREAFDLFGLLFEGHPDLRRILTDYDFVGHPLRKDFPTMGFVEMRHDAQLGRIVYEPVSVPMREITPRIVREENYGGSHG